MLRAQGNERHGGAALAGSDQREAGVRRRKEGIALSARERARENGQDGRGNRAVQTDLRSGYRVQGRVREGGRVLRRESLGSPLPQRQPRDFSMAFYRPKR